MSGSDLERLDALRAKWQEWADYFGNNTTRQIAIEHLAETIDIIKRLGPHPESLPGPEQSESGRAYQALTLTQEALSWLMPYVPAPFDAGGTK
jgi:hypothetical protein